MRIFFALILSLSLTACVTQDQADVKMAKGCVAAVNALIEDQGKEIMEVKTKRYAQEDAEGGLHRRVTIEAIEKEGWLELDKQYSCLFMQQWGLFKSSHHALLVQVKIEDKLYGKKDGSIIGSFDDFMKLTRVVDSAMGQQ
jgi:hypothetical protein